MTSYIPVGKYYIRNTYFSKLSETELAYIMAVCRGTNDLCHDLTILRTFSDIHKKIPVNTEESAKSVSLLPIMLRGRLHREKGVSALINMFTPQK